VCKFFLWVLVFCKCPDGSSPVKSFTSKGNYTFQIQGLGRGGGGEFTTLKIEKSIITKMKKHKLRRESDHKERTKRPKARQQHPKAKGR
jgi:hypothetical protein